MESGKFPKLDLKSLTDPGGKYKLGLKIGGGLGGEVHEAVESETGKKVAIKVVELKKETEDEIKQEYQVLKLLSANENFPEFYGAYLKKGKDNVQRVWLVIEFCEGGTAIDFARKLDQGNKKLSELCIAYIMREIVKAVVHLHENNICHRDIKGSNVVLTAEGKVKLIDYGISKRQDKNKRLRTLVGSPSWLAPEVITSQMEEGSGGYDNKIDVWAIGITAIELGDGQAPFEDMHPGRALFQIVQNPPPTLRKPSDWSQLYNDFINECLVKNPENRPFVQELLEHTFFSGIESEENVENEIRSILENQKPVSLYQKPEVQVRKGYMRAETQPAPEKILQEDLAALKDISEDSVLQELEDRYRKNEYQTFIGDILLVLNPNKNTDMYGTQFHKKYRYKAKSQNAPHIYAIAESAYRDVFHHEKPQHVIFAGETGAGKTTNMMHAIDHLLFLGQGLRSSEKVQKALSVIQAMGNATTTHNSNSTRHILQSQLTFTNTGKVSGAVFRIYQLEKDRVATRAKKQANFHLFYYFYNYIKEEDNLAAFSLEGDREYKILQTEVESSAKENVEKYQLFEDNLRDLEFDEDQRNAIKSILSAIILIGEIEFVDDEDGNGVLVNPEIVQNVANLLEVDSKKLTWALLNYCLIIKGEATMRHNSKEEADEAKHVLAKGLYSRLVDWVVNTINEKLSVFRVIYGDRHVISLLDLYGFECYKRNTLNQLFVNAMNEQLQFHYNQKIFAWDKQKAEEEEVPFPDLDFNDNKTVVDLIMSKPDGLLCKIDEATRSGESSDWIGNLPEAKTSPIHIENSRVFCVNHYTGKLAYDSTDMPEKNRDFLPPELIDTMRLSTKDITRELFSSLLTKSGNLSKQASIGNQEEKAALLEKIKIKENLQRVNTNPLGQYSQSRQMRTAVSTFRGTCFDILKNLMASDIGFHFVRCIRTDLADSPEGFHSELVRQQLRALAVVNTILTIQQGYSYSVSHNEFIQRYKFLAFDFDENVEETKENCRLLLLRLKLEGWTMGKTKVFLKYYNKEYLSRLYETQIKKIVKVQSMMRTFMARRKLYAKIKRYQVDAGNSQTDNTEPAISEPNTTINSNPQPEEVFSETKTCGLANKNKREDEHKVAHHVDLARTVNRKISEEEDDSDTSNFLEGDLDETQKAFIRPWFKRWRAKSLFQVLLLYRAERLQNLVNFCLQIHIYNQTALSCLQKTNLEINLEEIDEKVDTSQFFPPEKPFVHKLPFIWESFIQKGDVSNCQPLPECDLDLLESQILFQNQTRFKADKESQTSYNGKENSEASNEKNDQYADQCHRESAGGIETNNNLEEAISKMETLINENGALLDSNENFEQQKEIEEVPQQLLTKITCNLKNIQNNRNKPSVDQKPETKDQPKFKNSVQELEEKFKQTNQNNEEPLFNFRTLLRKTENSSLLIRDYKSQNELDQIQSQGESKPYAYGKIELHRRKSDTVITEIAPGILIHGKIADL